MNLCQMRFNRIQTDLMEFEQIYGNSMEFEKEKISI
jgi:hypothetical protein